MEVEEKVTIENPEDIALNKDRRVRDALGSPPKSILNFGPSLVFALLSVLLVLSWVIKYPDIIEAEAVITTQIPPQKEFANITGKIENILVEEGQKVHENTPLAIVENTSNYKDIYLLKSVIDTIPIRNNEFKFPIESLPVLFLGDVETDFAIFENNYAQYRLNLELQPFNNEGVANQLALKESKSRLTALIAQKELNLAELGFMEKKITRLKTLVSKGAVSQQEFENEQLNYLQAKRDFQNLEVTISELKESINYARKNVTGNQINKTREEITLFKNVVQSFHQLKKSIKDWEQKYVFKSNIEGNVYFINIWNKNQNVTEGDLVFTIIPSENSSFIAKLKAPVLNSGKIKRNQNVNIKLNNYPFAEFGLLQGKVENISAITNEDGFYVIDVILPRKLTTTYQKQLPFRQEMKGTAEIVTKDMRLLSRVLYGLVEVFSR